MTRAINLKRSRSISDIPSKERNRADGDESRIARKYQAIPLPVFPLFSVPRSRLERVPAVYLTNFLLVHRRGASKKSISRLARETDLSWEKRGEEREVRTERNRRRAKRKSSSMPDSPSLRSFVRGLSEIKPGKTPKARIAAFLRWLLSAGDILSAITSI